MRRLLHAAAAAAALAVAPAASADLIYSESFETDGNGTRYTTSVPEFSDGGGDFFTRTDGSNIGGFIEYTGQDGDFYFAASDIDGEVAESLQTLTISGIDIAGFTDLSFEGLFAEDDDGANQDWDPSDFFHLDYSIDGGAFQNLLWFEADIASGFNGEPRQDTDFDGVGDGAALSPTFTNFLAQITGTGSTLELRATFELNSGDEDIAIDNFRINGNPAAVPEPASFALIGFAAVGAIGARRRRLARS